MNIHSDARPQLLLIMSFEKDKRVVVVGVVDSVDSLVSAQVRPRIRAVDEMWTPAVVASEVGDEPVRSHITETLSVGDPQTCPQAVHAGFGAAEVCDEGRLSPVAAEVTNGSAS
jgi:hypothetical protein